MLQVVSALCWVPNREGVVACACTDPASQTAVLLLLLSCAAGLAAAGGICCVLGAQPQGSGGLCLHGPYCAALKPVLLLLFCAAGPHAAGGVCCVLGAQP
jgi:hypothetical protein